MSPDQVQSLFALALGFALAGVLATGYQLATKRPPSFGVLRFGPSPAAIAAVPFLAFAAPFIIMRNTIRGHIHEKRRFSAVMAATIVAGFWSMMSGTAALMALAALGLVQI
jgi:hypothetical protein